MNSKLLKTPFIYSPFWTGDIDLTLSPTDQLTISGLVSASSGTYNPRYPIYDSRTAMVLYLPRGVYVELAELALMRQAGKIPEYISYQEFVDTDACFEEAGAQLLVFIAEATIYPLYGIVLIVVIDDIVIVDFISIDE